MVFTFVLCTHTTTPLDLLPWEMQKIMVYKTAQVTWCCSSMIVAVLCYECLIMRFICVRQNFGVHKKAPHWVRASLVSSKSISFFAYLCSHAKKQFPGVVASSDPFKPWICRPLYNLHQGNEEPHYHVRVQGRIRTYYGIDLTKNTSYKYWMIQTGRESKFML